MPDIYYPGLAAGDAASVQTDGTVVTALVQPNSFVQVFEIADTARATPLTLKTVSGLMFTQVKIGSLPFLPDLYVVSSNFAHIWKSGSLEFRRDSNDAKDKAVADSLAAAQIAASNAGAAAAADLGQRIAAGQFKGSDGKDGRAGANGANVLPTQQAIEVALTSEGPAKAVLDATERGSAAVIEPLLSALDTRDPRSLAIAQASDSTGDSAAEWFEASWKDLLASVWPDRPARVKRWIKATDLYASFTTWQAPSLGGTPETPESTNPGVLGSDDFAVARANLSGTAPQIGSPWVVNGPAISVASGRATSAGGGASYAALPLGNHAGLDGTTAFVGSITGTGAVQQVTVTHTSSAANGGNRVEILIGGTGGATPLLRKVINGTTTVLATSTAALSWSGGPLALNASISITGLNVTASVNGTSMAASLTQTDVDAIGKAFSWFALNNASSSTYVESFERTGSIITPGTPAVPGSMLGYLSVYNAGYAGGRATHQLERLDAMFPEKPDALFINHGHNYSATDQTPALFTAAIQAFVDQFLIKWPGTPVVCLSQNPEWAADGNKTQAQADEHNARQRALRAYCLRKGWGYVPSFEAFAARADSGRSLINVDGIHPLTIDAGNPTALTGSSLQRDVAKSWIRAGSRRP